MIHFTMYWKYNVTFDSRKKKRLCTLNVVSLWFWFMSQLQKSHKGLKITFLFLYIWQSKILKSEPKTFRAWVGSLVADHCSMAPKQRVHTDSKTRKRPIRQVRRSREEEHGCVWRGKSERSGRNEGWKHDCKVSVWQEESDYSRVQ